MRLKYLALLLYFIEASRELSQPEYEILDNFLKCKVPKVTDAKKKEKGKDRTGGQPKKDKGERKPRKGRSTDGEGCYDIRVRPNSNKLLGNGTKMNLRTK